MKVIHPQNKSLLIHSENEWRDTIQITMCMEWLTILVEYKVMESMTTIIMMTKKGQHVMGGGTFCDPGLISFMSETYKI